MQHAVVWGRRRQGKSTLALALALASKRKPVVIFDPCSQFGAFPVLDPLAGFESGEPIFRTGLDGSPDDAFTGLMDCLDGGVWEWADYALIVDEASFLQRPQFAHPALARLIRQAPDDITVIQTLHRPSETHPTVRSLASDLFFFQTYLERDLAVIEANYGKELAETVSRLPQYHVVHWWLAPGGSPTWQVWNDPKSWYIDKGATMAEKPVETNQDESDEQEGAEAQPELEKPIGAGETPGESPKKGKPENGSILDPVQELLRVNAQEIRRLERQNTKLRAKARNLVKKGPLTSESGKSNLSTVVPESGVAEDGSISRALWNIMAGK